ncbi:MAG TPA: C39 family peptidase [Chloroflexota bacterium]
MTRPLARLGLALLCAAGLLAAPGVAAAATSATGGAATLRPAATPSPPPAAPNPPPGAPNPPAAAAPGSPPAAPGTPPARTTPVYGVLRRAGTPPPAGASATSVASPTPSGASPGASPSPSATGTPTPVPLDLLPDLAAVHTVRGSVSGRRLELEVPARSQFDGSEYQSSNCGPTSLAMVLEAFGLRVEAARLRALVNALQGTTARDDGVALDYLAYLASEAGLRPTGLRAPGGYRRWTIEAIRDEVQHGHPVITLVKMRELPDHAGSRSAVDHYIVVVGLDGDDLLINDPASQTASGFRRPITVAQLERAWAASSSPGQALAIAGGGRAGDLALPTPPTVEAAVVHLVAADAAERHRADRGPPARPVCGGIRIRAACPAQGAY